MISRHSTCRGMKEEQNSSLLKSGLQNDPLPSAWCERGKESNCMAENPHQQHSNFSVNPSSVGLIAQPVCYPVQATTPAPFVDLV